MTDKVDYIKHRVVSGYSPHKLLKMEIKKYLDKVAAEDIFRMNRIKWKGLD